MRGRRIHGSSGGSYLVITLHGSRRGSRIHGSGWCAQQHRGDLAQRRVRLRLGNALLVRARAKVRARARVGVRVGVGVGVGVGIRVRVRVRIRFRVWVIDCLPPTVYYLPLRS